MTDSVPHSRAMLMSGISGSGKTHYALRLVSEGYRRLSVDSIIMERRGASFLTEAEDKKKILFMESMDEVCLRLREGLLQGNSVVVDATLCKRAVRDRLRRICRECGVEPVVVYFDVPMDVLEERLKGRKGSGPDDLIVSREELLRYYKGFERPENDEQDVVYVVSK